MRSSKAVLLAATAALALAAPASAHMSDNVIRIGVLTDMSSVFAAAGGAGSVEAAKMAAEEFGNKIGNTPIEVIFADHQNKPDVGVGIARQWLDVGGVDAIVDLPNSAVALATIEVARPLGKVTLISGGGSSDITGKACSPTSIQWTYDTYATASGSAKAMMDRGGNSWFFITADYAFGHALERDVSAQVKKIGGTVVGAVHSPLGTPDFSSFLLQAQAAKPKVLGLAMGGNDTGNAVKQAYEFGLPQSGIQMIGIQSVITDTHALGLALAKGLLETSGFYWDRTPESRAWSKRYYERTKAMPTMMQAGVYSATRHYLQAIKDTGHDDGAIVVKKMKETSVHDMFTENGKIREDGRMVHDMYLLQVKTPEESKEPWDYYKVVATLPGDSVFRPLSEGDCPLVKK
jgi:branched-chain amino acid transport system substrate-binding protein